MLAFKLKPAPVPELMEGRILGAAEEGRWVMGDGRKARVAVSCLLVPEVADRVLVGAVGDELFVLHVLERQAGGVARVRVDGAAELRLEQESVAVSGRRRVALLSLGDVDVTAAQGSLSLNGRNLMITAADSLVENARYRVAQVHQYLLQVRDLWRVHSRHGLLSAERELKVDAERVSVG